MAEIIKSAKYTDAEAVAAVQTAGLVLADGAELHLREDIVWDAAGAATTAGEYSIARDDSTVLHLNVPTGATYELSVNDVAKATLSTSALVLPTGVQLSVPVGSAAAPSVAITGDLNTGIYSNGADILSFATGGVEAWSINSVGSLNANGNMIATIGTINLTGGQITFPVTQAASADVNILDDYEEGTWTPVLTFATPGDLSVVYSTQGGRYTKIGRHITLHWRLITTTFTHTTASGNFTMTGLPFTAATIAGMRWHGSLQWGGITKGSYTDSGPQLLSAGTTILFRSSGSGVATSLVTSANVPTGGDVNLFGTLIYEDV